VGETKNKLTQRIICKGPVSEDNGALIFRLPREKKEDLDIYKGQVLTVGEEITKEESKELLDNSSWKFSEVKE
jgi:hypothetical protein